MVRLINKQCYRQIIKSNAKPTSSAISDENDKYKRPLLIKILLVIHDSTFQKKINLLKNFAFVNKKKNKIWHELIFTFIC